MPYGIPKDIGGDSKENVKWMEGCVKSVMEKRGLSKSRAIAICKTQLKKKKTESSAFDDFNKFRGKFLSYYINNGMTFQEADAYLDIYLLRNNYEYS